MDQKHTKPSKKMRDLITDKELTLACDLTTKVQPYQLSSPIDGLGPPDGSLWHGGYYGGSERVEPLYRLHRFYGWNIETAAHCEKEINSFNGYMGVILVHEQKGLLLLAHRGMQFITSNMANCLNIALNHYVPITKDAVRMCQIAMHLISTKYKGFTLCHTGFSMGGFLAQITATACHQTYGKHNEAICYDAPGANDAINGFKWKDNRSNIMIYLTSPNLVNTGKGHYGNVRQIKQWKDKNDYQVSLSFATVESHVIDVKNALTEKNLMLFKCTLHSHNALFDTACSPFLSNGNFDFEHVQTWPLAINGFSNEKIASDDSETSSEYDGSEDEERLRQFVKGLVQIGNYIIDERVQQTASRAGVDQIQNISHQLSNPRITYSNQVFLHGEVPVQVSNTLAVSTPTKVYPSPLGTLTPNRSSHLNQREDRNREPIHVEKRTLSSPVKMRSVLKNVCHQNQETRTTSNRPRPF